MATRTLNADNTVVAPEAPPEAPRELTPAELATQAEFEAAEDARASELAAKQEAAEALLAEWPAYKAKIGRLHSAMFGE